MQNGYHFSDDTFKRIFFNGNVKISIKFSLKFVPKGPINNIPVLVQIMAWRRPGDKSLSEPIMVWLPTHICFTRPQWVNTWCKMAASLQTSFSNTFPEMKIFIFWFEFILRLAPKRSIDNEPALVHIMAWNRPGDKPLSEPCMVSLLSHIWIDDKPLSAPLMA